MCKKTNKHKGKPAWLKKQLPKGGDYQRVTRLLSKANLHTVCQEANCPNMFECFSKNTSTFMILGDQCTRHCRFCNITAEPPLPVDAQEPANVASTAIELGLKYVVITSVTRDDLHDGGADQFAAVIHEIKQAGKKKNQNILVEVLVPDFQGNLKALKTVVDASPDVINHNIETVSSLYPKVRPEAQYSRSLEFIKAVKQLAPKMPTKSGIMVGLGESNNQLVETMKDLFAHDCDILTIGQYLQPTRKHLEVEKYYTPDEFQELEMQARKIGFKQVASGAFVRSSYKAEDLFTNKQ